MKSFCKSVAYLLLLFFSVNTNAQKIKKIEGDLSVLKNETSINFEFTYDNMSVGKYATEEEYVKAKTAEYNQKEAGKGDSWAKSWVTDRGSRYEPKFIELFTLTSGMTMKTEARYTLIFKTKSIEPGYNVGGNFMPGGRKNAKIDAEVWIVETADKSKKIAVITIDDAPGGTWGGFDFDTGSRIAESYASSGKKLGKYIK